MVPSGQLIVVFFKDSTVMVDELDVDVVATAAAAAAVDACIDALNMATASLIVVPFGDRVLPLNGFI